MDKLKIYRYIGNLLICFGIYRLIGITVEYFAISVGLWLLSSSLDTY